MWATRHFLDLDDTYKDNFPKLRHAVKDEIGRILSSLQTDAFFVPSDDYLFERDPQDQSCACTHSSGSWENWKLLWYYQYFLDFPSIVEVVVVMLVKEELKSIEPRPQ
jgi:hypothetical protein